eukprot:2215282-Rhodomonas_salina.1
MERASSGRFPRQRRKRRGGGQGRSARGAGKQARRASALVFCLADSGRCRVEFVRGLTAGRADTSEEQLWMSTGQVSSHVLWHASSAEIFELR